jgi:hypothetical protein
MFGIVNKTVGHPSPKEFEDIGGKSLEDLTMDLDSNADSGEPMIDGCVRSIGHSRS